MSSNKVKIAVDVVIALALVLLYNTRTVTGLSFHEWAGIAIAAGFIVHVLLSWDWVVAVTTTLIGRTKPRARWLWVLDVLVLLGMTWTIVSGLLISRVAVPQWASNDAVWRVTHVPVSWLTLLLIGVHLGMHWQWVMTVVKRLLGRKRASGSTVVLLRVLAALVFAGGVYACVATDAVGQVGRLAGVQAGGPGQHGDRGPGMGGRRGPEGRPNGAPGQGRPTAAPGEGGQFPEGGRGGERAGDATVTWTTLLLASGVIAALAVPTHYLDQWVSRRRRGKRATRPSPAPAG